MNILTKLLTSLNTIFLVKETNLIKFIQKVMKEELI
jgi:hypothetical protein